MSSAISDAIYRAERYRDLAEECRRIATFSITTKMRKHYSRMSVHYGTQADAEELGALRKSPSGRDNAAAQPDAVTCSKGMREGRLISG